MNLFLFTQSIQFKTNSMKTRFNPFLILAVALATGTSLPAAILYWDGADTNADANGGAGNWDTTTNNWDDAATAGNPLTWPTTSTGDEDASFGTPGGAVVIQAGGITANSLTFTAASYILSGGKLTLDGTTPTITAGPGSNTQSATINSAIASPSGLIKGGGSTLVLGGDLSGVVGTLTIDGAITSPINNNAGIQLQAGVSTAGLTNIDIKNNSFLALAGNSLPATTSIILNGGGGNQAPQGAVRGTSGNSTIAGPVLINDSAVRIGNTGTSTTFSGAITAATSTHGLLIRIGSNQGVILTNTGNSWGGTTTLGEGSLYCAPGALPATSNLSVGTSAGADFGTNGTFTRPLGTAAGEIAFGRAADGLRPMGFTARGGALTVNVGGAAADFTFLATTLAATTNATFTTNSATVAVASATGLAIGHYVSGTGIAPDTRITAITGTNVTLSRNTTAASAASPGNSLTFTTLAAADNTKFGTYTLVLNGGNADSALTFQNPVDLNGFNRFLQTNANTATLTGGLKNSSASTASARKTGAGTLIHDPGAAHAVSLLGLNTNAGTLELKSGTVTVTGTGGTSQSDGTSGFIVARSGTFRLSGATVNVTGGGSVFTAGNTNGGSSTSNFILDSGTFDGGTKEVLNAYGATGATTINGGFFSCGTFRVSQGTGFLNLNGGTLRTSNLRNDGTATVTFNGGVLQARAANANFVAANINTTRIQAGGAIIDSNGFAITIPEIMTEDSGSTGGGLTKRGNGILDLTADNTYTGTNLIEGGVLRVSSTTQLGVSTAPVTVNGGEFGVAGTGIPSISSLARTFTYTTGGFHVADASHTLNVDIALTGSAALSKSGPGVLRLSGANDFTGGITMGGGNNGWIEVDSATDLGTGTKIANMASSTAGSIGGIRLLGDVTVTGVALNLGGRNVDAATQHALLNVSGNNVWSGNINIVNPGGTYYLRSDSGRLELSGTLSNAQAASLTSDTRAFNLEGAGDYLISGTIADGVNANRFTGLVMNGTGTATLTGTNTYTGSTQVKFGTLALVGGSQASPITVDSDATLGFTAGSPTTSTSTVTFAGANPKVKVTGTLVAGTLMTATSITGTPVLDPAIPGFNLAITGGGTTLALVSTSSDNYETWATTNGVTGQAANLDHDNDGVSNGVEYFVGGPNGNTTGFTALPSVTTVGGVRSITWTKAATYTGVYNTDFVVETSTTLGAGSWITEPSPGTVTVSGNDVTYTFPAGPAIKFARLKVTGP